jgi:hypothetical protein
MIVYDKPEAEYHSDTYTLSSTGAKTLLRSPRTYRYQLDHPKQIAAGPLGSLTHALVLGTPLDGFKVKDWDGRTKEGKLAQLHADAAGLEVLTQAEWDLAHDMATEVMSSAHTRGLFTGGNAEVSLYGEDPITGIPMRGRVDYLRDDDIVDLKTGRDASPAGFARAVASLHYHLQYAWYERLASLNGRPPKRFIFVVVEKEPPFLTQAYVLSRDAQRAGAILADRACEVYRDCTEAEKLFGPSAWPDWGRPTEPIETLDLPRWAINEVEDPAWV